MLGSHILTINWRMANALKDDLLYRSGFNKSESDEETIEAIINQSNQKKEFLGQNQETTKRPRPYFKTQIGLIELMRIRLEAIKEKREIPKKALALDLAGISDRTFKTHAPLLRAKWDDKSYTPENLEDLENFQ